MMILVKKGQFDWFFFYIFRHTKAAENPVSTEKEDSKMYPKKKREHDLSTWKDYDQPEAVRVPMDQRETTGTPKMPTMFKSNFLEPRESNLHIKVYIFWLSCYLSKQKTQKT